MTWKQEQWLSMAEDGNTEGSLVKVDTKSDCQTVPSKTGSEYFLLRCVTCPPFFPKSISIC